MDTDRPTRPARKSRKIRKLRWGILGTSRINRRLLPAFARAANAEVVAIASRSLERAQAAATEAGIPRAHGSYAALVDDPDIDAVYVPLPNSLHCEWTCKAADRGKHVMCEKPLAPTADEAQAMIDHCAARGVLLMDGFMWPHHPRTKCLKQLIVAGQIGEIRRVTSSFTFRMANLEEANIRLEPDLGGGCLLDVGCYPVFAIRWAFGAEPVRVYATAEFVRGVDVDMNAILWLTDGRTASFDCGFTLPIRQTLEVGGTEGVVRVEDMWLPPTCAAYRIVRDGKPTKEVVCKGEDQIVHMIEGFSRAIQHNLAPPVCNAEAIRTLRVLDALARSAREGKEIDVAGN
jgi:predicted dehydrogenase